ncbi:MAG: VIT domain-containing protein [Bacteroidales bacterium]
MKCSLYAIIVLLIIVASETCSAQISQQVNTNLPRLVVKNESTGQESTLKIDKLKIDVVTIGNIATTTIEMTFYNSTDKILEGELVFPLAEGQTVSRFALDVNGKLREGVVVEKQKGQQVFEAVVRKNIDPGLLEKTKGNNFKARVYPIPAKGYKTALIAFESELIYSPSGYTYLLPMNYSEVVSSLKIHVEVLNQDTIPTVDNNEFESIQFKHWQNAYITDLEKENYLPNKQLGFRIPFQEINKNIWVDKGRVENENYFYVNIFPPMQERDKALPKKIALFWDVSTSSTSRDFEAELKLLDKYFSKIQNLDIELITFSNTIIGDKKYTIQNGKTDELFSNIKSLTYDGGTQLGMLNFNKYKCDEIILVSDAVSNFGKGEITLSKVPVITISSNQTAEHSYLQYISSATAGIYLNLKKLTTDQALGFIAKQKVQFISAEYNNDELSEIYPSIPTHFTNSFSLVGKLKTKAAILKINFGYGNEIVHTATIQLGSKSIEDKGLVERIWAQKYLNELNFNPTKNAEEITRIGKKFSVVTNSTSLIVLDRVEDYVQYEITPPQELLAEYNKMVENKANEDKRTSKLHIDQVVDQFLKKVEWWNTDFKIQPKPTTTIQPTNLPSRQYSTVTKRITGTVVSSEDGMPIPGVSVVVRGISIGATTNLDGKFEFTVPTNAILQISYIGFKTIEIDAVNITNIDITLEPDTRSIEEVVVVANGISRDDSVIFMDADVSVEEDASEELAFMVREDRPDISAKKEEVSRPSKPTIEINEWNPDVPYLKELRNTDSKNLYTKYLLIKKDYLQTPSFYFDVADYFFEKGKKDEAIRILSNVAELKLENYELLRILARKLQQVGEINTAICIFEDVLKLRSEEPQSYRDLGLAYAANKEYQKAVDMLYSIVEKSWDNRFPGVEVIVLGEINAIIEEANGKVDTQKIDQRLLKNLPVDIRVVLNWDANNTDMDLWVTDPFNEKCFYQRKLTNSGGYMSNDFTGGYGPEEFLIKKGAKGKYKVQINYYGSSQQTIMGPVTVQVQLFTKFGSKEQVLKEVTMRLSQNKEVIDIGDLIFDN